VWKFAYTHNERRQSSLKATQLCCGSALPPKTGAQSGTACGGGVLIVRNMTMLWFVGSLFFAIIKMKGHVFTKIHKKSRLVIQNNLTLLLILAIIIG
jgi:hypothetical protein